MPRGVYDRSKTSAKRSATKATKAATKATVAAEMVLAKVGAQKAAKTESVSSGHFDLYAHLASMVSAWEKIAGNTQGQHSPTLLSSLEAELVATVGSLTAERQAAFVQPAAKEETVKKAPAAPAAAPAPTMKAAALPPAPLPVPAGVAPAPLPFTPAAVQEVMKQAGTN